MPISYMPPRSYFESYASALNQADRIALMQREQAIRWEGAQEYDTLIKSGVQPAEAMRRSAAKLFYNDPAAFARAISEFGQQPGQIFEQGGRQFIQQPGGKISAVPQRWMGTTTVMGPDNQIYKIPLTPEELATAPRTSVAPTPPQVVPLPPGQGSMIVQPSGTGTRVPAPPTEFVKVPDPETGAIRTLTTAEYLLEQAQTKAKPLLDQIRANKAEMAAGEKKAVWDWIPGVETYEQKNARMREQLKVYDLDENGNPIPGSKLAQAIQGTQAAPVGAQPATAAPVTPVAPVGPVGPLAPGIPGPGQPVAPTLRRRQISVTGPWLRPGPTLGSTNPPLNATIRTAPLPLGPNEKLMRQKSTGKLIVVDTATGKPIRYYGQ